LTSISSSISSISPFRRGKSFFAVFQIMGRSTTKLLLVLLPFVASLGNFGRVFVALPVRFKYPISNLPFMSRQIIDSIYRIFDKTVLQADKGQYKEALENLETAEKLSKKANRPEFLCQTLMLKGRALLNLSRQEEALVEFQRMLELAIPLFLENAEDTNYQYFVYNSIGFTVKTLTEIGNVSKTKESLARNEKYFEETFAAFEKLIAKEPENFKSIGNYLKTLENVRRYYTNSEQFEKQTPLMGRIVKNYGKNV